MPDGSVMTQDYRAFLEAKVPAVEDTGFTLAPEALHPWLRPHARLAVSWMLRGGRRAVFANFGLHKTSMQLEASRRVLARLDGATGKPASRGLIVAPLGVRQEFMRDAEKLGITIRFVRSTLECWGPGLYLSNYESVREGKIDLGGFDVVSLDEAACLRGMGGTKTFRVIATALAGVPYRFVATATPSPNEYIELLAYAEVLGVMDIGQAKTRFFRRNSEKADELTLHPHKEREFWIWVASWALFISKPSDLGCSDDGYELPELVVRWHEIGGAADFDDAEIGKGGQALLFKDPKISVVTQAREKRGSMLARVARAAAIRAAAPDDHFILWHDLNDERDLIVQAMPAAFVLDGSQDDDTKEGRILGFSDGYFATLAAKPVMAGAGCNFQRWCHRAVFVGIGFKFHDFIQAIHRIYRFGQQRVVEIDVIYGAAERGVRAELERRWAQHREMGERMGEIIREFGLSSTAMADLLSRSMGVERIVSFGPVGSVLPDGIAPHPLAGEVAPKATEGAFGARLAPSVSAGGRSTSPVNGGGAEAQWWMAHNDCVDEVRRMPSDSVDLIVTSIPFSTQYEYSPNYADFGHTDDNDHFWTQMGYLIPELLRVLKPGRDACIHVKDRITPGGVSGLGFQTLQPFGDECRYHFRRAGFAYLGTITNVTDVVRENNQTYRLAYSEQLKDGTRMGCGVPEQIILLRKPPSDLSDGYADMRVEKRRPAYVDEEGQAVDYDRGKVSDRSIRAVEGDDGAYTLSRWQLDAGAFWRSAGDRLLKPEEWLTYENMDEAYKLWKGFNLDAVYDYEQHVLIGERFAAVGKLPTIFQLLPPHSWHADVWTDVAQMRSLNSDAARKGQEKHLCPLPFDIVERLIRQRSMAGDLVFDPFAGIGTVPYCAVKMGRRGAGVELSPDYFASAAKNCALAEAESAPIPTLFDLIGDRDGAREVAA